MQIECRHIAAPVELRDKHIVGVGSVFYDGTAATEFTLWRGAVERIAPTAFDRAIKEGDDVRGLFNHDPNMVLGRTSSGTMKLSVTKRGLEYDIEPGDTTVARDVAKHLERGDVSGSSFAFRVLKESWTEEEDNDVRTIEDVQLFDTGPVTFPAYGTTSAEFSADNNSEVAYRAAIRSARESYDDWKWALAQQDAERMKQELQAYWDRVKVAEATT